MASGADRGFGQAFRELAGQPHGRIELAITDGSRVQQQIVYEALKAEMGD